MRWIEYGRWWGTTAQERERRFPCDALLPDHNDACYRGVGVFAEPAVVFRWLCQLRVAPYSYDWIDNLGRKSSRELTPGLEDLELGQRFMTSFELVEFLQDVHVTLALRRSRAFPSLVVSYRVVSKGEGECRLLVKLVTQLGSGFRDRTIRQLGPWLDWIMMRRQLLNLKALAEGIN